ncbi:MAG: hypothetical protein OHK93_000509 [Ramalina farinacea]|uniref:Uncharacterized protein n=1 Tax=Ramalina farinacea TaxID=258253 RepID=A0AA43TV58_9LECA|nr:hypothetical protein [Ramalina farinacea]
MKYSKLCESGDQSVPGTDAELKLLQEIVVKSHELCLSLGKGRVSSQLMETKEMLRVKKLARYWTACDGMADASKRYAALFKRVELQTLAPYEPIILPSKPADLMVKCHVHAEIQLLCYYAQDPSPDVVTPRVIGVSKSACYLCNLFFSNYDCFYITYTHGKLYHRWTVPDTFVGASLQHQRQRQKVRQVLSQVNEEVSRVLDRWRTRGPSQFVPYPNESDATLPRMVLRSVLPSEVSSRQSHLSSSTITAGSSPFHSALNIPAPPSSIKAPALNMTVPPPRKMTPPPSPKNVNELSAGKIAASGTSQPQEGQNLGNNDSLYSEGPLIPASGSPNPTSNVVTPMPLSTPSSPPPPYARGSPHSTIDVWKYPLQAPVTADRPIKTHTGNMHMEFSVEAGAEGTVEVSDVPRNDGHAIVDTIDVRGMRVGEDLLFRRDENEGIVVVYLQNGKAGRLVQVRLHWR